jgi:hypothetical protein
VNLTRDAYASGVRQCLKAGCDIDAIAQEVTTSDHHVTDMDPYAKAKRVLIIRTLIQALQGLLDLHGTHHSIDGAGELSQNTVTCRVGDAATIIPNELVHDLSVGCESLQGAHLVLTHKARVSCDIGCKDRCQPSCHPL